MSLNINAHHWPTCLLDDVMTLHSDQWVVNAVNVWECYSHFSSVSLCCLSKNVQLSDPVIYYPTGLVSHQTFFSVFFLFLYRSQHGEWHHRFPRSLSIPSSPELSLSSVPISLLSPKRAAPVTFRLTQLINYPLSTIEHKLYYNLTMWESLSLLWTSCRVGTCNDRLTIPHIHTWWILNKQNIYRSWRGLGLFVPIGDKK